MHSYTLYTFSECTIIIHVAVCMYDQYTFFISAFAFCAYVLLSFSSSVVACVLLLAVRCTYMYVYAYYCQAPTV